MQAQHLGRLDLALERAAEGGADAAFDQRLRARGIARGADAPDLGDHVVRRLAQVGQAVRVARGQRHEHQVGAALRSRARRLSGSAPAPRRTGRAASSRKRRSSAVSASCGSSVRRDERADFDLALAGGVRVADPFELLRRSAGWSRMLCRPSRRPTSRMTTERGNTGIAAGISLLPFESAHSRRSVPRAPLNFGTARCGSASKNA